MRILLVHATKTGSTAEVAGWLADELTTLGHEVTLSDAAEAGSPEGFDAVVVGSGIRAGSWHAPAAKWVTKHAAALRAMPVATFTSSLRAAEDDVKVRAEVAGYTSKLLEPLEITPVCHGQLVGAYDPARASLPERLVMKALKQGASDQRDPEAVRAWAREAAEALAAAL